MIYLDNAATTLYKPNQVYLRSNEAFRKFSANAGRSGHSASKKAAEIIFSCRSTAAEFLGVKNPENIIFTFGCTDALSIVIKGLLKKGDHVITTAYEHNSVLRPLEYMHQDGGVEYSVVFPDVNGVITEESFFNHLKSNSKAIILNLVSNVTGYIQQAEKIISRAKNNGLLVIADCAQAAGILDVSKLGIDYICCAGHKSLYGPQGIGILAINENAPLPLPLRFGGTGTHSFSLAQPVEMPEYLESGTLSVQNIAALEEGINFVKNNFFTITEHEKKLANRLYDGLNGIIGITLYSDKDSLSNVIAFNVLDVDSTLIAQLLDEKFSVCCRGGFHCAPLVHKFLKTEKQGAVRFSLSAFNTNEEIDKAIDAVFKIRKMYI